MSLSQATITPANLDLGPCQVTFNGVDLGSTLGNVKVMPQFDKADLMADQLGKTVIDRRVSGFKLAIETELAEVNLKDNWKVVFPHAHLVTSGGNKQIYFDSQVGDSDTNHAAALILHPLARSAADKSGDVKVFLACADSKSEFVFGPTEQQKLKITWNVLPDFTTNPPRFAVVGDPTIGLNAATAGSPTAGSNTGNGTITAATVANGFTKTETITLTCVGVGASSSTEFSVVGSVSGILGVFNLAHASSSTTNFVSNPINFTATQGSTAFVVGDTFTIATTAANYV